MVLRASTGFGVGTTCFVLTIYSSEVSTPHVWPSLSGLLCLRWIVCKFDELCHIAHFEVLTIANLLVIAHFEVTEHIAVGEPPAAQFRSAANLETHTC